MMNLNIEDWFKDLTVESIIDAATKSGYVVIEENGLRLIGGSLTKVDKIMDAANNVLRNKQSEKAK